MRVLPSPRRQPVLPRIAIAARRPFARAATLVAMVAATLGAVPAETWADELQDVAKLVASGNLDTAEQRADRFLEKSPKDAQMRFLKGVIVAQRGRRDEAVERFVSITQDYPELPEPYNNLAVIYAARGEYDKARDALETAVRVSPQYATAYENLGDVYAALAARAYQDSRRYDANNAQALRKLNATRSLLTTPAASASTAAAGPAVAAADPTPRPPVAPSVPSQRNVGLPSPAGPRVSVGGFGATAPEIVVPADATAIPQGSNVVAIEAPPAADDPAATSVLRGASTTVAGDTARPAVDVTAAVRAAVDRWASPRGVKVDDLRIRVDGDTATARFRESPAAPRTAMRSDPKASSQSSLVDRVLTLRGRDGTWTVTDARTGS